jgi:AcrR family transcriptional regulator
MHGTRQVTSDKILTAASELFSSNAYAAISVDEIAHKAGLTKVTVYQHFKSKDNLVLACLRLRLERRDAKLNQFLDQLPQGIDPLLAVFDWLEAWLDPKTFRGCSFLKALNELVVAIPEVREIAKEAKEKMVLRLTELATTTGRANPKHLARQLALLMEGAQSSAIVEQSARPARTAKQVADLILASSEWTADLSKTPARGTHN